MNDAIKRLKEKAQNEKTVIGLSELLRLAKEENKELRAKLERGAGECSACAYYRRALKAITSMEHTATPGQLREIARNALEGQILPELQFKESTDPEYKYVRGELQGGGAMKKENRPPRAFTMTRESYWKWAGRDSFINGLDINTYGSTISAQERDWFYEGLRKERDRITNDERKLMKEEPTHKNEEPHLKVVPLYESNFRNIPEALRKIADQIESGENGEVNDCVIVTQGTEFQIYHNGAGNVETAHLLLACAQRRLELAVLNHYE